MEKMQGLDACYRTGKLASLDLHLMTIMRQTLTQVPQVIATRLTGTTNDRFPSPSVRVPSPALQTRSLPRASLRFILSSSRDGRLDTRPKMAEWFQPVSRSRGLDDPLLPSRFHLACTDGQEPMGRCSHRQRYAGSISQQHRPVFGIAPNKSPPTRASTQHQLALSSGNQQPH